MSADSFQQVNNGVVMNKKNAFLFLFFILSFASLLFIPKSYSQNITTNQLRVLTWSGHESFLPRATNSNTKELQYITDFAEQRGFTLEIVNVEKFSDLIPALLSGKGDIIATNFTATHLRKKKVQFTQPIFSTTEYLVMSKKAKSLSTGSDLNHKTIYVQRGTSYSFTAQSLSKVFPKVSVKYIDQKLTNDDLLDRVANGTYELTILDGNTLSTSLTYRKDIKKSLQANSKRGIAWAVRPGSSLLKELNEYIDKNIKPASTPTNPKNAWDKIVNKRVIRFTLLNSITSYYIHRGELHGFNYDLARSFAKEHNLQYEIVVAPDNNALIDNIEQGKADVALSFMTPTKQRKRLGVEFSRPYHYSNEVLVSHGDEGSINNKSDLNHRTIAVRASSAYWQTAQNLKKDFPNIILEKVPEGIRTENIIEGVADGLYDLTITDNHIADLEINLGENIKVPFELTKKQPQSWAIKKGNKQLLSKVDRYIKKYYKGLFYNVTYNKYFKNIRRIEDHHDDIDRFKKTGQFSKYDRIVDKYAKIYGFNTNLLISQMYQESRFNQNAKSFAGARGLFQVMPATAKELNLVSVYNPDIGIHAGVKYLKWVEERLSYYTIVPDQQIWFALAAYNAGAGHVTDAIRLAKIKGWRTDMWFNHVEKAMLLLSQQKYARQARYGFVRGREPVNYVRNIKQRFHAYEHVTSL